MLLFAGDRPMSDFEDQLERLVDKLREERDDLRVRVHLLHAELRDEWEQVEHKWHELEPRLERLRETSRESSGEIGAAVEQLGEEIGRAYRRLRDALK